MWFWSCGSVISMTPSVATPMWPGDTGSDSSISTTQLSMPTITGLEVFSFLSREASQDKRLALSVCHTLFKHHKSSVFPFATSKCHGLVFYLLVCMFCNQSLLLARDWVCFIANFAYLLQYCITITRSYLIFADFGHVSNSFCRTIHSKDKHERIYDKRFKRNSFTICINVCISLTLFGALFLCVHLSAIKGLKNVSLFNPLLNSNTLCQILRFWFLKSLSWFKSFLLLKINKRQNFPFKCL